MCCLNFLSLGLFFMGFIVLAFFFFIATTRTSTLSYDGKQEDVLIDLFSQQIGCFKTEHWNMGAHSNKSWSFVCQR